MEIDYTTVTEIPGNKVTREQIERAYTRYRFASEFCEGKDVKDWSDFNPSPFSTKYFSVQELFALLKQYNFDVELFGDCPVSPDSAIDKIISIIKRTAVYLHLMPKTMRMKAIFKRVFFGKLLTLKEEIEDGVVEYSPPMPIPSDSPNLQYKVLYAVAHI